MSLVVVVNGQFKNYEMSDINPNYRVRHLNQSNRVHEQDKPQAKDYLEHENVKHPMGERKAKIDHYEKVAHPKQRRKVQLARDIMSSPVHSVNEEDSLSAVSDQFNKYNFRHMPVFKNGQMTGMISDRDILKANCDPNSANFKVKDVMTKEALLAKENSEITFLARVMLEENISALPIIDDEHNIVGMVTHTDILKVVMTSFPLEAYT